MEITSKKVITFYEVEITFNEFWEALQELVETYKNGRAYFLLGNKSAEDRLEKFIANNTNITLGVAKTQYCEICNVLINNGSICDIVIKFIAKSNGYSVSHYGSYYDKEKVYRATFQRNGNHIE